MTTHRSTRRIAATFAGALLAAACGPGAQTANQVQNPPPSGKAQLAVTMTATTASPSQQVAPGTPVGAVPQVKAVIVNVTQVTAHVAGIGWKTIGTTAPGPIDVLKLSDPSNALALGLVTLDPGTVTQVRLLVAQDGNQVVFPDDTTAPLKVPSGYQSGIKIHGPWTVSACNRASVTLELDGKKSIWFHPASGGDEWILRPVIRVKRTEASDVGCGGTGEGAGTPPAPAPTPTGEACNEGRECLTTVCSANVCAPGGPGAPCGGAPDCASGACDAEGTCAAPPTAKNPGDTCSADGECRSNACVEQVCQAGPQGAPCVSDGDCAQSLLCFQGFCSPQAL